MMIGRGALMGLGAGGCTPPSLTIPANAYTTDPLAFNAALSNCAGTTGEAIITNNNRFAQWQNDVNNAQLNGQPAPPCPAYQQPNCQAITDSLMQAQSTGKLVDSSNWVTNIQSQPMVQNAIAPVPSNPVPPQVPQPTPSANAAAIIPAAAVTPPVVAASVAPATGASTPVAASTPDTILGLPTLAVIGIAAVGAYFVFGGGHR